MTISRKTREKAARETLIIERASHHVLTHGFHDLNLDSLAREVEYSKGTLYQHFSSKEDLLLAVSTRALRHRADLFERALTFNGSSRERACAIGYACCHFMVDYPDYFRIEMMTRDPSFWVKASEARQHEHRMAGARTFRAVLRTVNEGRHSGDLPASAIPDEHVAFSMIAMTVGSHVMGQGAEMQMLAGINDPVRTVRENQDVLLDGHRWQPLSGEHDYTEVERRIRTEVFPGARA